MFWIKEKMKYFLNIFSILVSLILYPAIIWCQNINFKNINIQDGLSQGSIVCIAQDKTGYMWFGSYEGLNRFDGYNFTVFKNDPTDSTSLSYDFIRSVCADNEGR
ncbi:hypothetical protein JW960_26260, partial [candidate division KSB1 bacterium]|nr:hypothetical protein [candidate division KSB1 bacterium]